MSLCQRAIMCLIYSVSVSANPSSCDTGSSTVVTSTVKVTARVDCWPWWTREQSELNYQSICMSPVYCILSNYNIHIFLSSYRAQHFGHCCFHCQAQLQIASSAEIELSLALFWFSPPPPRPPTPTRSEIAPGCKFS